MALDNVPWFIGGGAEHGPEVARMLAYAATAGSEGIISSTDLRVTALPTPGSSVRVYPGGAALLNRYPGAPNQTYTVRSPSSTDVAVPATSGAAATRYVIVRVDDPQYGGQVPANRVTGPYVRYDVVNSITDLAYPFIALARINQPANTATITGAMITDLREICNPRRKELVLMGQPTASQNMTSATGQAYPNYRPNIEVPSWAVEVSIVTTIASIASVVGNTYGELATTLGNSGTNQFRSANTNYDVDYGSSTEQRHTFVVGAKGKVPAALRGTVQPLGTEFRRIDGPGYLATRRGTTVIYNVTFSEAATE
ncbi:hypothetical protein ACFVRV_06110 [Arthrobacter koreensis]|uniref:hypothetical protein n=1 Tax=Arthrobacter koreensis TaxID=199136 RepID=UPI0036DBFABB